MDAREIERCIDEFGTDIYRFFRKLCIERSDAEDLYQQTFLRALEQDWSLDWTGNPRALFFSLAYNLWKSEQRKQARRSRIAPCGSLDEEALSLPHSGEGPDEEVFRRELAQTVRRIITELPEKIRVPLTLFYLSDCSVPEIAKILGKPPGTIKSRLFKGRKLIQKRLEETGYEKGPY